MRSTKINVYFILLLILSILLAKYANCNVVSKKKVTGQLLKLTGLKLNQYDQLAVLFEDTFKGMGILTWLIYFSRTVFINVFSPIKNSGIETQNKINSISNLRS